MNLCALILLQALKMFAQGDFVAQQSLDASSTGHDTHACNSSSDPPQEVKESRRSEVSLKSKRHKSMAWDHFEKIQRGDTTKAIMCKHCQKEYNWCPRNGTKVLLEHNLKCPALHFEDQTALTLGEGDGKMKLGGSHFDQEASRRHLAYVIIMHEYNLSVVEHIGFNTFSKGLEPRFKVISRRSLRRNIMKIYDFKRSKTLNLLKNLRSRVAVTTDMWTCSNQRRGFMVITSHFIDDSRRLQSRILRFAYVPTPHTAEILAEVLHECLLNFQLDRKLSTVTIDNSSTNYAMMRIIYRRSFGSSLMMNGKFIVMGCCAHILNLIVKEGLEVIEKKIDAIHDSVVFFDSDAKKSEKFLGHGMGRKMRIQCTKKLPLECRARWNSTYLMSSVVLEYREVFKMLVDKDSLYQSCPPAEDWDLASDICCHLRIFYNATELFSERKYPTSNDYFSHVCEFKLALLRWLSCNVVAIKEMVRPMLEKFNKYRETMNGMLGIATMLDP